MNKKHSIIALIIFVIFIPVFFLLRKKGENSINYITESYIEKEVELVDEENSDINPEISKLELAYKIIPGTTIEKIVSQTGLSEKLIRSIFGLGKDEKFEILEQKTIFIYSNVIIEKVNKEFVGKVILDKDNIENNLVIPLDLGKEINLEEGRGIIAFIVDEKYFPYTNAILLKTTKVDNSKLVFEKVFDVEIKVITIEKIKELNKNIEQVISNVVNSTKIISSSNWNQIINDENRNKENFGTAKAVSSKVRRGIAIQLPGASLGRLLPLIDTSESESELESLDETIIESTNETTIETTTETTAETQKETQSETKAETEKETAVETTSEIPLETTPETTPETPEETTPETTEN